MNGLTNEENARFADIFGCEITTYKQEQQK